MENEEKYQVWEKWNWTRGSLHNSCSMEQKMKNAPLFNPTTMTTEREEKKLSVDWLIRMMFILWQSIFLPVYAMLLLPKLNYLFRYFSEKDAWYVKYTSHTSIEIKPFAVVSPAICNFAIFREPYSFIVPTRPIYSHTKLIFHVCMEKKVILIRKIRLHER